ncbi:MAG: cyclic nucleotide-binding domain-containing protein [Treponema sp.]
MPKAITYNSNSVVYFAGDFDERVFLLQSGSIALTSVDIETGGQVTNYIKEGEFFGVKSALGNFPREDNAIVLTNSVCLAFQTSEFEEFAQSNTRIILQMIKVFSKQLRSIHKNLASLLDSKEDVNPEDGLFSVVQTFYNSQHYDAANQVSIRYLQNYPRGKYKTEIAKIIQSAKDMQGHSFGVNLTHETRQATINPIPSIPTIMQDASAEAEYSSANELFKQGKFDEAGVKYQHVIDSPDANDQILEDSYIKAGRCIFETGEYVKTLQLLTGFIGKYPKSSRIAEALVYLGLCYDRMKQPDKALAFYDKALLFAPALAPKIQALKANLSK